MTAGVCVVSERSPCNAHDLLTHVGRISVGYYDIGTVAAKINKRYLGKTD